MVIRGLVYLTGLATLALVACVAAVTHKVHEWPWGEYVREGSDILADKLDPRSAGPSLDGGRGDGAVSEPRPASPRDSARTARLVRHTVRRGDTLYALARRYYDDQFLWRRIARANDIRRPSDMRVGRVIVIPPPRLAGTSAAEGDDRGRNDDRLYDLKLAIAPALEVEGTHSGGDEQ